MSEFRFKIKEKGFTLAEVLVVVVIIGILVAIAIPIYSNNTTQAKRAVVEANLRTIDSTIMQYGTAHNGAKPSKEILVTDYLQTWPEGPDKVTYKVSDDGSRGAIENAGGGAWCAHLDKNETLPINWDQ